MRFLEPLSELRALFRRHPALRRVFLADVACQLGDGGLLVAFPLLILQRTSDVTLTGLGFSGEILAMALFSPLAGVVADRRPQLPTMRAANAARLVLLGALLLVLDARAPVALWLALSFALGAVGAFFGPARSALLRSLLDGRELEEVLALDGTMVFLMRLLSPAAMGAVLSVWPATAGIAVDMAAYAVAIAFLLGVGVPFRISEGGAAPGGWREGWRTIAGSASLRTLLGLDVALCLLGMAAFSLAVAFLQVVLHLGPQAVGWLSATTGLCGAVGSQSARRLRQRPRTYLALAAVVAVTYLAVPHAGSLRGLLALWGVRGLAIGALGVLINQRLAVEAPAEAMGRVNAAWSVAVCIAAAAGSACTPWLLRSFGPGGAYALLGAALASVLAAAAATVALLSPEGDVPEALAAELVA